MKLISLPAMALTAALTLTLAINSNAQTGPATPWILEGNSNVNHSIHWLGTTNTQDLIIKTNALQRMVVEGSTGNFGIGTTAPGYPLSVENAVNARTSNFLNSAGGAGTRYSIYSFASGTGTGTKYGGYFEANNGTGINYGISVKGSGTNTSYGVKSVANGTATNYGINSLAQGNNTNYGIYSKAIGLLAGQGTNYAVYGETEAGLANSWAAYFKGRGYFSEKVGIGTTSTISMLTVRSISETTGMVVQNDYAGASSSYGYNTLMGSNATGNKYGFNVLISNGSATNYGVRAEVLSGTVAYGMVGIATTSGTSYGLYGKANGTGSNRGVYGEGTVGANAFAGYFVGRGYFSNKVGIGTTAPSAFLHVDADALTLPMAVQINGASKFKVNSNGSVSIGGVAVGADNGLYVLGSVSIGTAVPATGYALSVDGKVMCEEMRVELQGSWPDYVFADDYKLLSIKEMEQHINQFNHLPGMPSADEMEQSGGIDIGTMQTKMMEKIEELSLYIIQLEKKIEKIESAQK